MASFSTDGSGRWWVTTSARQCPNEVLISGRCQGAAGHDGPCWQYAEDGSLHQHDHAGDGGATMTPPGNERYVHPADMAPRCYRNQRTTVEVTDPAAIALLAADNLTAAARRLGIPDTEGRGHGMLRPLRPGEWEEIQARMEKDPGA